MPKQNDGSLHSSSHLVRKDTCSAVGYWETSACCLKIFPIWFAVSSFKFPKKGEQTQLFMEKHLNRRFSKKRIQVLVLLLPVAIVSPYAAWKAWHPTFEPLASPPKIEFKSIEVPSSSLAFLAVLCFVFLLLEVFRCCSNFFWKLQISPYFVEVIRVKHAAWLSKVIWSFPRSTRWKIPCRTLWKDSAPWLSKEFQRTSWF